MKRIKFYVCPHCGSILQGNGNSQIMCCGNQLEPLKASQVDDNHIFTVSLVEDDFFVEFDHEMEKEHYISFVSYAKYDRALIVKLYPEQNAEVRFTKMNGGKLYFYCTKHGLFEKTI